VQLACELRDDLADCLRRAGRRRDEVECRRTRPPQVLVRKVGILSYSDEPLVSSDIVKSTYSAVFDSPLTSVVDETQLKVVAWYDNEWGYSNRLVELALRVATSERVLV
jgi:glyceraldehyde 3-phosphate dehydrogenase